MSGPSRRKQADWGWHLGQCGAPRGAGRPRHNLRQSWSPVVGYSPEASPRDAAQPNRRRRNGAPSVEKARGTILVDAQLLK